MHISCRPPCAADFLFTQILLVLRPIGQRSDYSTAAAFTGFGHEVAQFSLPCSQGLQSIDEILAMIS